MDPRTEWDTAEMYLRSEIGCNGRKKTSRKKCNKLPDGDITEPGLHFCII